MEIKEHYSIKGLNTFGVEAKAKYYASFQSVSELKKLLKTEIGEKHTPFVLGGGSNLLLTKDLNAFVLKNEITGKKLISEHENNVIVEFGAGEIWHDCVLWAIQNNWAGIENLSLIPGSVGAAPIQNIGAYGVELKECFHSLTGIFIDTLESRNFNNIQCQFGYRDSIFKKELKGKFIITSVQLKLSKKHHLKTEYGAIQEELNKRNISSPSIHDISNVVIAIRQSKLPNPKEIGNSGSFFKNPIVTNEIAKSLIKEHPNIPHYPAKEGYTKIAAGWLIEQSGWKGKRKGDAGMHEKQALVLVNHGNASGLDLKAVSEMVQKDVYNKFGLQLEAEVNIL